MKRLFLAVPVAASLAVALPAEAQFRKPEDAMKYRQSVMVLQNFHLGRIFAMANNRVPFDAKVVAEDAAVLAAIDKLAFVAFTDGTDKGDTRAKPEVWSERAKFDAGARKLHDDVARLVTAARGGDQAQIRSAVGTVGETCKGCHDTYRKE